MIINPKLLKKRLKTARVSESYIARELSEPNFFNYEKIELDLEQSEKLLEIFTAKEVISAMPFNDRVGLTLAMNSVGLCQAH